MMTVSPPHRKILYFIFTLFGCSDSIGRKHRTQTTLDDIQLRYQSHTVALPQCHGGRQQGILSVSTQCRRIYDDLDELRARQTIFRLVAGLHLALPHMWLLQMYKTSRLKAYRHSFRFLILPRQFEHATGYVFYKIPQSLLT